MKLSHEQYVQKKAAECIEIARKVLSKERKLIDSVKELRIGLELLNVPENDQKMLLLVGIDSELIDGAIATNEKALNQWHPSKRNEKKVEADHFENDCRSTEIEAVCNFLIKELPKLRGKSDPSD